MPRYVALQRALAGPVIGGALAFALFASPLVGQGGRPFRLQGLQGGELRQADLSQGVVIAVVFAAWSPRCREIVEQTNSIVERWGGQARVIMVDFQEDSQEVKSFLAGKKPKASVYLDLDGAFSKNYAVSTLPGMVIFKDGNTAFSGRLPSNPDSLISQTLG